jgi:putative ABC transport system permease protein
MERSGMGVLLSPAGRMVWRNIERRPLKAGLSCLGIAMALAVLILGSFTTDALQYLINFQFRVAQRQDVMVTFIEPIVGGVKREIQKLPGVMQADFFRSVATRLRHEHHDRRVAIMGLDGESELFRLMNDQEQSVTIPQDGLLLNTKLAELLDAKLGDEVTIEVLEGQRGIYTLPVTGLVTELGGLNAYMYESALHRMLQEDNHVSGAFLKVAKSETADLYRQLKETPNVAGVSIKAAAIQSFNDTIANNLGKIRGFNVFFATIIAVGVVYNSARIALAERSRELATLRVMGFSKAEVSTILLGELAILTLAAIPLGMAIGYALAYQVSLGLDTEVYRIPLVVNPSTYATAALVVIGAAIGSGWLVRRGLGQLDLVGVLKTKE